ncbi:MAG: ElyC/SanA/YdcF family protein [Candidatus Limivivens sp.]|nr:ElyC/SanA/YdcF family protein [Candidatus Limivivens sp.]
MIMGILLIILGIACLVYYGFLAAVSMDFGIIWLVGGLALTLGGAGSCILHRSGLVPPHGLKVFSVLVLGGCLLLFLAVEAMILKGMTEQERPDLDVLVVLGAQVRGQVPSRALTKRLEKAEAYLKENPDTRAVLSGGRGDGEEVTEASAMYHWLVEHGIEGERLILEERSTSTEENLRFSAEYFHPEEDSVGILTNNFHVFRAVSLAKKQGYRDVSGIAASSDARYQVHYLVREFFALIKEKLKGNL